MYGTHGFSGPLYIIVCGKKLTKTKPITFHTSLNILICLLNSFFFLCYMKYLKLDHFHHVGTQHQSSKKKFYTVCVAHNYAFRPKYIMENVEKLWILWLSTSSGLYYEVVLYFFLYGASNEPELT